MKWRFVGPQYTLDVPVLETDRLILRPWRADDVPAYARILRDPDVMRHWGSGMRYRVKRVVAGLIGRVSHIETRRALAAMDRHWRLHRFGLWALEAKDDGALLGSAGLAALDHWTADTSSIEVGWLLARSAWGRGYAVEAGRAILEHAFRVQQIPRVVSVAFTSNWRSERVMQNLGLLPAGRTRWMGDDVLWYGLDRSAWRGGS